MGINVWVKDIRADLTGPKLSKLAKKKIDMYFGMNREHPDPTVVCSRIPERLAIRLKGMADQAKRVTESSSTSFLSPVVMFTHSANPVALIQELAPGTNQRRLVG